MTMPNQILEDMTRQTHAVLLWNKSRKFLLKQVSTFDTLLKYFTFQGINWNFPLKVEWFAPPV